MGGWIGMDRDGSGWIGMNRVTSDTRRVRMREHVRSSLWATVRGRRQRSHSDTAHPLPRNPPVRISRVLSYVFLHFIRQVGRITVGYITFYFLLWGLHAGATMCCFRRIQFILIMLNNQSVIQA